MKLPSSEKSRPNQPTKARVVRIVLLWIILWPIIIGISSIVLLIIASLFYEPSTATQFGIYFGAFLVLLVLICWVLITTLRRRGSSRRLIARVLEAYTFTGMILIIIGGAFIFATIGENLAPTDGDARQAGASLSTPTLSRDEKLDNILRQIGAPDEQIKKFSTRYVEGYDDKIVEDQQGAYMYYINNLSGEFLYGELTVQSGLTQQEELGLVAHEYLHHVWYSVLDEKTQDNLSSHLIGMYGRDEYMKQRVDSYDRAGTLTTSELFSYYCTEVSDGYLTDYVRNTCNEYFNRGAMQFSY